MGSKDIKKLVALGVFVFVLMIAGTILGAYPYPDGEIPDWAILIVFVVFVWGLVTTCFCCYTPKEKPEKVSVDELSDAAQKPKK